MKPDQERVKNLLTDTVTLLCKNGLTYTEELKVEGLLGITLDNNEVFLVHINEKFAGVAGVGDKGGAQQLDLPGLLAASKPSPHANSRPPHTPSQKPFNRISSPQSTAKRPAQRKTPSPSVKSKSGPRATHSHSTHSNESSLSGLSSETPGMGQDRPPPVLVKEEEDDDDDDVMIVSESSGKPDRLVSSSSNTQQHDDADIMRQTYGGVDFSALQDDQGSFPSYEPLSEDQDIDTEPPRKVAKQEPHSDSADDSIDSKDPSLMGGGSPYVTGLIRNAGQMGANMDDGSQNQWNNLTTPPSLPGCSSWPAAAGGAMAGQDNMDMGNGDEGNVTPRWRWTRAYRPRNIVEKGFDCPVGGCHASFYHRRNMLRHVKHKHTLGELNGVKLFRKIQAGELL